MKSIITLGGSNSRESINKILAEHAGSLIQNAKVINLDLNDYEIPLYSIDVENANGFSEDLKKLNRQIVEADGIILSLAEHNGAYTAAFKNAFDWLSRMESKTWRKKPMLLLSTSPGARGGQSVMAMALDRFPRHDGHIVFSLSFPSFNENFKEGEVLNPELKSELDKGVRLLQESL
jgi:NAD(P)H-dependent FMN reductase